MNTNQRESAVGTADIVASEFIPGKTNKDLFSAVGTTDIAPNLLVLNKRSYLLKLIFCGRPSAN